MSFYTIAWRHYELRVRSFWLADTTQLLLSPSVFTPSFTTFFLCFIFLSLFGLISFIFRGMVSIASKRGGFIWKRACEQKSGFDLCVQLLFTASSWGVPFLRMAGWYHDLTTGFFFLLFFPGVIDYKHLRDGLYIGSGMNGHMKAMRDIYRYYYYVLSGRGRQARCMEHSESWISLYNLNCFFWGGQVYISCCIKI